MTDIQRQIQALTRTVQKLRGEVDGLHSVDRNIAQYSLNTETSMPRLDLNYEKPFNIASMRKDMRHMTLPLTHRERQVLNSAADGNTNKQIAYILRISEQTVKNHLSTVFSKLNANDRTHAVVIAIRNGWLFENKEREDTAANVQGDVELLRI